MRRLHPLVPQIASVAWGASILWFCLASRPPEIGYEVLSWDKFQHAAAFGILALLFGWGLVGCFRSPSRRWLLSFLLVLLYGALVEIAQELLTVSRSAEWNDVVADAAGAAAACLVGRLGASQPPRPKESAADDDRPHH
jgi:VanZ family protein